MSKVAKYCRSRTIGGYMKLCKDCKHFVPETEDWGDPVHQRKYAICALTSRVTGFDGVSCSLRREWTLFAKCGPSGKQWEAK